MEGPFLEYQRLFQYLDSIYSKTGFRLSAERPKHFFTSFLFWEMFCQGIFIVYFSVFQRADRKILLHQMWCLFALIQWLTSAINRQIRWDEVEILLKWFEQIYTKDYPKEYREIFIRKCCKVNDLIRLLFRF